MKPTVLNQRYRLVELVGAGGMATVYRGEDLLLERAVAVKFLREPFASDPKSRERFIAEARAAARLDHANVVRIYDVGEDEGQHPYIVMELVEGDDLKTVVRRDGPLSISAALNIARQICEGVGHAHRAGIVHCDLKPQNIIVTPEGVVKVADFGIARALRDDSAEDETVDVVWGSPHYISPEQVMGHAPTPASDVYSIGVILYEMLTGVPPFHDPDPNTLVLKHVREEAAPLTSLNPRVPKGLDWLVRKVLSKEPAARYRNGDQLAMALDAYVRHIETGTHPFPASESTPAAPSRAVAPPSEAPTPGPQSQAPVEPENTQPVAIATGFDFTLWALFAVAAIAVIGLIPLWVHVYRTYSQPVSPPLGTPVDTTPVAPDEEETLVTVPNLTGLNVSSARELLTGMGLELAVAGEREDAQANPGAILQQNPATGLRIPVGSTVNVLVAMGRAFTLPDVVGYDLASVEEGLRAEGLDLIIEQIRNTEPVGMILGQEPSAGQEIRAGDRFTLTVSGGADVPISLQANLNNQALLEVGRVPRFTYRPGETIPVTLRWRCLASFDRSYKVFVHLLTMDLQTLIAQDDTEPVNGLRPTNIWAPGDVINDPHQLTIPQGTPAGTYQIRVGLYDPAGRLPVIDPGQTQVLADSIFVTTVEIRP